MKLHSESPYWLLRNGLIHSYPQLHGDIAADVVIIGAGITAALIGDALSQIGKKVVLIDRRDVACGSTSASTALLQYEMDTSLCDLRDWAGPIANDLYRSGQTACDFLRQLCEELDLDVGYHTRPSCYFASTPEDADTLQAEFQARREIGLPVEIWEETQIQSQFDFSAPAALWSQGAGEVDPYRLTHALLQRIRQRGGQVFDRSQIRDLNLNEDGITFQTEHGSAHAAVGVIAAGYESMAFLPEKVAELKSTFAFATEPLTEFPGWPERCLLWESARPYLYIRSTADGRMLVGGADVPFRNERLRDRLLAARVAGLAERVWTMFPRLPLTVDYSWAGTFGETKDGLPFIGPHPARPGLLFALCYGGNGITFSVLASEILRDHIQGKTHPLAHAVAFDRPSLERATGQS